MLYLLNIHTFTHIWLPEQRHRINLRKTVNLSGIRCYDKRLYYPHSSTSKPICLQCECSVRYTLRSRTRLKNWDCLWRQSQFDYLSSFHLLEECHDTVDYFSENGGVVVPTLDKITTILSMLVKGYKFTGLILVDQASPMTCTTSP